MSSKGSQELLFSRTPVRLDAEHTCGTKSLDAPSLEKVSVTVKSQQLLTVIGPVGAGKSSLLSAILGELPCDTGTMKVKGQLTYASQQPWVFPGTIRSNILFGRELNLQRAVYQEADIYLLDDPLSAVDAEVGKHLFEQCICGLLRNKCRILVTHQLQTFPTDLVEITGFLVGFSKIAKHVGSYFSSSF
ncbi:ATP-binding cassette subfamily C member 4 isoform X3 [Lates calcarifer]|uniref:ATP-binding cassette subfamily C member 4 isoform X3 n=1 Tax=Lates calcarifer TaxID=8187 RepID=A0AAJ8DNG9_LATCA|nr:ATP-binding cassette subfamily C member 4 isoform X3 [Lates calcarifer]